MQLGCSLRLKFLKEKHHYVTSVPICALKGQKNDVCCRYVCNFWDMPPFDDPPEFCNRFEEKK